jgi:hypothetical protein
MQIIIIGKNVCFILAFKKNNKNKLNIISDGIAKCISRSGLISKYIEYI